MTALDPRIPAILAKLSRAQREGKACFGSNAHRFLLEPPLREEDVAAFESTRGARLPEAYRSFLIHAGNGGAGPYYGLLPLAKSDAFAGMVTEDAPPDWLARPSPLVPGLTYEGTSWGRVVSPEPSTHFSWLDALGLSEDTAHDAYVGTLTVGLQGCSYMSLLVVSGPYAGRVVYADAEHQAPYVVHDVDFIAWYERWLDELLAGFEDGWFGFGMVGGEGELARVFANRDASEAVRLGAIATLQRMPSLAPSNASCVLRGLDDALPAIRQSSIGAVKHFRWPDGLARVLAMRADGDASVRASAVRAAAELEIAGWIEAVRPCLHDRDPGVGSAALFALNKAGALTRADLLPLLASKAPEMRRLALWAGAWTHEDAARIAPLLDDPSEEVRRYAILGLRSCRARAYAPLLARCLARETDLDLMASLALALGELADASIALAPLAALLAHDDDFVRLAAIEALGKLGDPRGAALLEPFLTITKKPSRAYSRRHTFTFAQLARPAYERCRRA